LEQDKQASFSQPAASERFAAAYPQSMTPELYVDALNQNASGALSAGERDALVAALKSNAMPPAQVRRRRRRACSADSPAPNLPRSENGHPSGRP
jgi:hypothetical protein